MNRIIITFLFVCIMLCSCEHAGHTPEQCKLNDTVTCIVERKSKDIGYDIVLHIPTVNNNVTFRNIHTNKKRKISNNTYYNKLEVGDTVFEIVHHCPYYVRIVKK